MIENFDPYQVVMSIEVYQKLMTTAEKTGTDLTKESRHIRKFNSSLRAAHAAGMFMARAMDVKIKAQVRELLVNFAGKKIYIRKAPGVLQHVRLLSRSSKGLGIVRVFVYRTGKEQCVHVSHLTTELPEGYLYECIGIWGSHYVAPELVHPPVIHDPTPHMMPSLIVPAK